MTTAAPAPAGIELIADFVNTIDLENETDQIADSAALRAWLGEHDLLPPGASVSADDVARAHEVRESIRALLLANNGEPLDASAIGRLNEAADQSRLRVRFAPDGHSELLPDERGVPGALARILGLTYTAMADETWPRLKACRQHSCQWAFYDQSKNRSRTWCSMQVCGNRTKARAYRERRRG
jgi:predicted RNA-binding Zn ribbon-like protein